MQSTNSTNFPSRDEICKLRLKWLKVECESDCRGIILQTFSLLLENEQNISFGELDRDIQDFVVILYNNLFSNSKPGISTDPQVITQAIKLLNKWASNKDDILFTNELIAKLPESLMCQFLINQMWNCIHDDKVLNVSLSAMCCNIFKLLYSFGYVKRDNVIAISFNQILKLIKIGVRYDEDVSADQRYCNNMHNKTIYKARREAFRLWKELAYIADINTLMEFVDELPSPENNEHKPLKWNQVEAATSLLAISAAYIDDNLLETLVEHSFPRLMYIIKHHEVIYKLLYFLTYYSTFYAIVLH